MDITINKKLDKKILFLAVCLALVIVLVPMVLVPGYKLGTYALGKYSASTFDCTNMPSKKLAFDAYYDHYSVVEEIDKHGTNTHFIMEYFDKNDGKNCEDKAKVFVLTCCKENESYIKSVLGTNFFGVPYEIVRI